MDCLTPQLRLHLRNAERCTCGRACNADIAAAQLAVWAVWLLTHSAAPASFFAGKSWGPQQGSAREAEGTGMPVNGGTRFTRVQRWCRAVMVVNDQVATQS